MRKNLILLLLLVVCIPSVLVLLKPGFYEPHDLHHIADIYEMIRAIQSGQIPPRLGPDFSYGYGYPLFNYYYVLPFYMGALFWYLVGSLTLSFKLIMIFGIISSGFGMYLFLKEITNKFPAFIGAILYIYTPYRAVQVYVRGAVGEVVVMALIPFVAWSFVRLVKKPDSRTIALSALITSFFILAHNYLSFMSLPIIIFLILPFILQIKNKTRPFRYLIISFIISLVTTSYWWIPALTEQKLVRSVTPFPLADHFPFIKQLIIPSWGYGASVWGPGDELSFQIGLVNLAVMIILGVVFILKRLDLRKNLLILSFLTLLGFCLAVIFMNVRTLPLWKLIPFYNFIQFPWRLLIYTTLFTSIAAALISEILSGKLKYIFGSLIVILSIILTLEYFQPQRIVYKSDDVYLERFFADRSISGQTSEVSNDYMGYSEDYLLLPKWVDERPLIKPASKIEVSSDRAKVLNIEEKSAVNWKAEITASSETSVIFNSYYFPGWRVKVDGKDSAVKIRKPHGQMEIEVASGEHTLEFLWSDSVFRNTLNVLSLLGLLTIGVLFTKPIKFNFLKKIFVKHI
jgi:hypothetical protein